MEKKIALSTLKQHKIEKKERITGGTVANSMSKLIERLNSSSNITSMSTLSETSDSSISNLSENSDNGDNGDNNGNGDNGDNNNNVELTINETSVSIPPPPEDDEVEENTTEAESIIDVSDDESTQDLSGNNI